MIFLQRLWLGFWIGTVLVPYAAHAGCQPQPVQPENLRPAVKKHLNRARLAATRHQIDSVT